MVSRDPALLKPLTLNVAELIAQVRTEGLRAQGPRRAARYPPRCARWQWLDVRAHHCHVALSTCESTTAITVAGSRSCMVGPRPLHSGTHSRAPLVLPSKHARLAPSQPPQGKGDAKADHSTTTAGGAGH